MTYSDARYEMLNMTVGFTKVIASVVVTRWSAETWEVQPAAFGMVKTTGLANSLKAMGFTPEPRNGAASMVAEYQAETGCDWSTALAACNCD